MRNYDTLSIQAIQWKIPLLLYAATWLTTTGFRLDSGMIYQLFLSIFLLPLHYEKSLEAWTQFGSDLWKGLEFSVPLMFLLTCHEFGHYFQTRRYRVYSSLPHFIPIPFGPFGTLGAVIAMDGRIPNRKALFDIGISGPIAGLIPSLVFLYYGIKWSSFGPAVHNGELEFGEPLLFQFVSHWIFGPMPVGITMEKHPLAVAAWMGLFLTSLNLLPLSQLDGGHVFYALLGKRAAFFSGVVFCLILILVIAFQLWHWTLLLVLLSLMGISHPPTEDDNEPLSPFRKFLGWAILAFVVLGLTPKPIDMNAEPEDDNEPAIYCLISDARRVFGEEISW